MRRIFTFTYSDKLLGISARAMFVLVKPAVLWAAIQLDDDSGMQLAQVYLIGLLIMSLTGTNAHRAFYRARFEETDTSEVLLSARKYYKYIEDLSQQILAVVFFVLVCTLILPYSVSEFVYIGIVFALAEKFSDELIRYSQFCLNNRQLMVCAVFKVSASLGAVFANLIFAFKISLGFPLFLFLFMCLILHKELRLAIKTILVNFRQGFTKFIGSILKLCRRDAGQVGWVLTTMVFMSVDKWTIQIFSSMDLAQYMFVAQIAAIFIIFQTTFILAPARVDLVNQDPYDIPLLQFGSIILTLLAWFVGLIVAFYTIINSESGLLCFPFFISGIIVLSAPHLERLYWVAPDFIRVVMDLSIIFLLGLILLLIRITTNEWPDIQTSLILLTGALLFRLAGVWTVIRCS